jgi:hypothetical protein
MQPIKLLPTELSQVQQALQDYAPAQTALATLVDHDGNLDASLEALLQAQMGSVLYGDRSLKQVTLEVLRDQLCGDDGFRQRVTEYSKNRDSAPLLTGLIVYLATQVTLPFPIDPGLATLAILYITKVSLEVFCRYTESEQSEPKTP